MKNPTDHNTSIYLKYKRILQRLLRKTEREHYEKRLKENIGNVKKLGILSEK